MGIRNIGLRLALIVTITLLSACASTGGSGSSKSSHDELVGEARASLQELYASTPEAKELQKKSVGILVFPGIFKAGLIIGGSGGNGVLFGPDGRVMGYYNAAAISYGLQIGAQSYSEAMFFTAPDALEYLDDSAGWSIGAGPSVVVVDAGAGSDFSSTTLRSDVYAFIYGQEGLMGGIGLQGQKITKLEP